MINKTISLITLSIVIISSMLSGNTINTNAATNNGGGKCTYSDGTKGTVYGGGKTCCVGPSTVSCEAITRSPSYIEKNNTRNNTRKTNVSRTLSKKTNKKVIPNAKISTNNKSKVHTNHSYIS